MYETFYVGVMTSDRSASIFDVLLWRNIFYERSPFSEEKIAKIYIQINVLGTYIPSPCEGFKEDHSYRELQCMDDPENGFSSDEDDQSSS